MKWIRWAALVVTVMAVGLVIATITVFRIDSSQIRPAGATPVTAPAAAPAEPKHEGPSNELGDLQQLG